MNKVMKKKKKRKKIKHNILRANGSFQCVRETKNVLTNFNVCFSSAYVRQTNRFVFTARLTVFTNSERVTVGTYTHIIITNVQYNYFYLQIYIYIYMYIIVMSELILWNVAIVFPRFKKHPYNGVVNNLLEHNRCRYYNIIAINIFRQGNKLRKTVWPKSINE